jgi:hypothetical protein
MANFHLRSSRDSGTSVRDEEVRRKNIKEGRGNSTAEGKKKFKPKTPKGVTREEMSGKSDAPAKPKAAAPKPKAKAPFALTPGHAAPTPRPDPITTGSVPTIHVFRADGTGAGANRWPHGNSASASPYVPATPRPRRLPPSFTPPFNPQMSDASILHRAAGAAPGHPAWAAGMETAPRQAFITLAQRPASSPFTGGPTGPGPGVDQRAMLARMLGLGV